MPWLVEPVDFKRGAGLGLALLDDNMIWMIPGGSSSSMNHYSC